MDEELLPEIESTGNEFNLPDIPLGNINVYNDVKKRIYNKYPQTKKFKKIKIVDEYNIVKKIYNDNIENIKDKIENNDKFPLSFLLETENYIILKYHVINNHGLYVFYNEEEDIDKLFNKKIEKIECGQYEVEPNGVGGYNYKKIDIQDNVLLTLADNIKEDVYNDVEYFMNNKKFYDENKITYKRGIMLYGSPGNGKTTLIRSLVKKYDNVYSFIVDSKVCVNNSLIESIKYVSADKMKILILEDIDRSESYYLSSLLNVLDGVIKIDNFYIVATCNDLSKVDKALLNRPSRFDKIYIIEDPDEKQRKELLSFYFKDISTEDLKECINLSKGFNCAYFKEIFICSKIHKLKPIEAVKYIKKRLYMFDIKKDTLYAG